MPLTRPCRDFIGNKYFSVYIFKCEPPECSRVLLSKKNYRPHFKRGGLDVWPAHKVAENGQISWNHTRKKTSMGTSHHKLTYKSEKTLRCFTPTPTSQLKNITTQQTYNQQTTNTPRHFIWDTGNIKRLESFQNTALKRYTKSPWFVRNTIINPGTKISPLKTDIARFINKYI